MDALPDAIIQYILSHMKNAKDVARCNCVSKRWKESTPFIRSLFFPRDTFDDNTDADTVVGRMITSTVSLEELMIYCSFSPPSLASWLLSKSWSLRHLDLRLDSLTKKSATPKSAILIDCIGTLKGLETLVLWGVLMNQPPNWGILERLHSLKMVGTRLTDAALLGAIKACPNLTDLTLLCCGGAKSISIILQQLEHCKLDFFGKGDCSVCLSCPNLQLLEVQGCGRVRIENSHCLQNLTIANSSGKVYKVEVGEIPVLDYLSIKGIQWNWSAVRSILQNAREVKHLVMRIENRGDLNNPQPFPEIDLVEFFNNHPKLQSFEIHGAMFAALRLKNTFSSLDSSFVIPSLEEVLVTVRSPLNAEEKMHILESLVRYGRKLQKLVIRASQMKNYLYGCDDFFQAIHRFKCLNHNIVQVE